MEQLIDFLKENKIDYVIGIIKDNNFYKITKPNKDKKVVKFKWKSNAIDKLILKLQKIGVILIENDIGKYDALYDIKGTKNQVYIVNKSGSCPYDAIAFADIELEFIIINKSFLMGVILCGYALNAEIEVDTLCAVIGNCFCLIICLYAIVLRYFSPFFV